ncbi:MAG TPA: substrate-binding domain-containing protein [Asanoa sp.]|nr:substrate-binding domain-containing protein [Asanoa sp.]
MPLTSVRAPRAELGRHAAQLLLDEIEARDHGQPLAPRHLRFEPDLVPRASTATRA